VPIKLSFWIKIDYIHNFILFMHEIAETMTSIVKATFATLLLSSNANTGADHVKPIPADCHRPIRLFLCRCARQLDQSQPMAQPSRRMVLRYRRLRSGARPGARCVNGAGRLSRQRPGADRRRVAGRKHHSHRSHRHPIQPKASESGRPILVLQATRRNAAVLLCAAPDVLT
jgi:hypothetical protein